MNMYMLKHNCIIDGSLYLERGVLPRKYLVLQGLDLGVDLDEEVLELLDGAGFHQAVVEKRLFGWTCLQGRVADNDG